MSKLRAWFAADKKRWLLLLALALGALLLWAGYRPEEAATATAEERRLAQVLSAIEGAGRVEVAIQYAAVEVAAWSGGSGQPGQPVGAIIVAEGGADVGVRMALIRALRTLLGLPEAAVDVFVMEGTP